MKHDFWDKLSIILCAAIFTYLVVFSLPLMLKMMALI